MRYLVIFSYDKKKWYLLISLTDINLTDNDNLYTHHRIYINFKSKNNNDNDMQNTSRHEWEDSKRVL